MKILFTQQYDMLTESHIKKIEALSREVEVIVCEDVLSVIADIDVLVAGKFDNVILERARALKWVHALAAGVERLLFPAFVESDIILTTSSGVHPIPIGEHVLGMMLMLTRRLDESVANQGKKAWKRPQPSELYRKTLGIIGFGSIGERIGYLGKCFGMYVIGIRKNVFPHACADEILPPERLHDLLRRSDFVVVSLPLTGETEHVLTEREFNVMKETSYIINVARGKIICEKDLAEALQKGKIAGAGLDVFEEEPLPKESPLWELPHVIVTPHYAGATPEYFNRAIDIFCENVGRFLKGEPLRNVVDKRKGY